MGAGGGPLINLTLKQAARCCRRPPGCQEQGALGKPVQSRAFQREAGDLSCEESCPSGAEGGSLPLSPPGSWHTVANAHIWILPHPTSACAARATEPVWTQQVLCLDKLSCA